jgi:saccharopine dehydrogenase-like NADP-dependent oxidoreductase
MVVNIMILGIGAVGFVAATKCQQKALFEKIILADQRLESIKDLTERFNDPRVCSARIDASESAEVKRVMREANVGLLLNATLPRFNLALMEVCLETGAHYMDLASTWAVNEGKRIIKPLGQDQFTMHEHFARRRLIAITGMGMDPGVSNLFAAYAARHLLDEIDEIGVRDGDGGIVEGYDFAPTFSPWVNIAECISMPVVYEDGEHRLVEPFSGTEVFDYPEIGPLKSCLVEHEEVVTIPRHISCKRADFKYALGDRSVEVLRTLHSLGLTRTEPVEVNGVQVIPRAVVCALLPDPAKLGGKVTGKVCVGTLVKGKKDGREKAFFLYNVTDHQEAYREMGAAATAYQTGIPPVIAAELIGEGILKEPGVFAPEQLDPDPFMERLPRNGFPWAIREERYTREET